MDSAASKGVIVFIVILLAGAGIGGYWYYQKHINCGSHVYGGAKATIEYYSYSDNTSLVWDFFADENHSEFFVPKRSDNVDLVRLDNDTFQGSRIGEIRNDFNHPPANQPRNLTIEVQVFSSDTGDVYPYKTREDMEKDNRNNYLRDKARLEPYVQYVMSKLTEIIGEPDLLEYDYNDLMVLCCCPVNEPVFD